MPRSELNVAVLYSALDAARTSKDMSWRDIAADLEISPSTFTRMAQGKKPDVDTFSTLIRWLGMKADDFLGKNKDAEESDPIAMVSTYLRSSRNLSSKDADALEDIVRAVYRRLKKNG